MNEVMTFQNGTFGNVRTVQINGAPWFVAKDIALALDYRDAEKMTRNLDDDEKLIHTLWVSGQNRETSVINESGLYHAVLISRKPQAKAFRKWVTGEVLPQIARHGHYEAEKDSAFLAMENEYLWRENYLLHKMERLQTRFSKKSTKLSSAEKMRIISLSKTMSVMEICRAECAQKHEQRFRLTAITDVRKTDALLPCRHSACGAFFMPVFNFFFGERDKISL